MTISGAKMVNRSPADPAEVSTLAIELLLSLQRAGVSYCYWKGSRRLRSSLSGAGDLDLLVALRDRDKILSLLATTQFKIFMDPSWLADPSTVSFLGWDETSARILHVHVHFWITLGSTLFKPLRLPVEEEFLARAAKHPEFPIVTLDPVDETLLLLIRGCFEARVTDPLAARRLSALRTKFQLDFDDIRPKIKSADLFERALALFGENLALEMRTRFESSAPFSSPGALRRKFLRRFSPYKSHGSASSAFHGWRRLALHTAAEANRRALHLPLMARRRRLGAGAIISIVGVDGSGKSTLVAELKAWLGDELEVMPIYFGTGDGRASLILLPFKYMALLLSIFIRTKPRGASHGLISDREPSLLYSILFTVWATAVAIEKRQKLSLARRAASRGFAVVTDRFPQIEVASFNDGQLLHRIRRAPKWLVAFERRIYESAHLSPPDLLIKLHATSETVRRREPEMDLNVIRARLGEFADMTFGAKRIVSLQTEMGLENVIKKAKREVWAAI